MRSASSCAFGSYGLAIRCVGRGGHEYGRTHIVVVLLVYLRSRADGEYGRIHTGVALLSVLLSFLHSFLVRFCLFALEMVAVVGCEVVEEGFSGEHCLYAFF